ncbi:MAG: hypothetical protein R3A48_06005 [Polyangiales bacterium]
MASIDLRLRNLETAELLIASFESEVDAALWLRERPAMMEVLGVIAQSSDPALHHALKRAVRPLDAAEAEVVKRLDDEADRAYEQRLRDEEARAEADRLAHIDAVRNGDPARPFQVRWSLDGGFAPVDPIDEREINADMQAAILEWVRERDTWVADRGQVVGEAVLTVWPLAVPEGEARVQRGGRFTPVSAPTPSSP